MTLRIAGEPDDDRLEALYRAEMEATAAAAGHPSEDEWLALATGTLAPTARDRITDHLVACAECAAIYRALSDLQDEAVSIDAGVPSPAPVVSVWWASPTTRAAAALVVIVLGTAAIVYRSSRDLVVPQQRADTAPATVATPRLAGPAPVDAVASWAGALVALDVRMPPSLALTMRGDASRRAFVTALGRALDQYRAGAYAEAAASLAPLASANADVPEVAFYAGLSHLLAGDPAASVPLLTAAQPSALLGDDARWFAAVAHERLGDHARALAALSELCARGGTRGAQACRAAAEASR